MAQKLKVSPDLIAGDVDEGYGKLADVFRRNLSSGKEVGAAFAVYRDGRKVVDLWGGYCVFKRYYNEQSQTPAGDVIRGIDWLGNGGFVRNLIEKARDHRNSRLDTDELDALLAADSFDAADEDPDAPVPRTDPRRFRRRAAARSSST